MNFSPLLITFGVISIMIASCRVPAKSLSRQVMRNMSSIEEIAAGEEKVRRHRAVVQKTVHPTTFSKIHGPGTDLHIPKNMTELSVFSGMPAEHQNRTVVIAPRQAKTLQSGM